MMYYVHYKFCYGCYHTEFASHDYDDAVAKAEEKVREGFNDVSVRYHDPRMGDVEEHIF